MDWLYSIFVLGFVVHLYYKNYLMSALSFGLGLTYVAATYEITCVSSDVVVLGQMLLGH